MFKIRHELIKICNVTDDTRPICRKKVADSVQMFLREVDVFNIKMNTVLIALFCRFFSAMMLEHFYQQVCYSFHCYPTCVTRKTSPKMSEVSNHYSQHRVTCSCSKNFTVFVFFLPFFLVMLLF